MKFTIGDKIILSEHAQDNHICPRQNRGRIGTVVGYSKDRTCYRIVWDDNPLSMLTLHESYVEKKESR